LVWTGSAVDHDRRSRGQGVIGKVIGKWTMTTANPDGDVMALTVTVTVTGGGEETIRTPLRTMVRMTITIRPLTWRNLSTGPTARPNLSQSWHVSDRDTGKEIDKCGADVYRVEPSSEHYRKIDKLAA
jgi:hypothetical protein